MGAGFGEEGVIRLPAPAQACLLPAGRTARLFFSKPAAVNLLLAFSTGKANGEIANQLAPER
jgi:hypothetical protein